ncbi:sodium-dependent glucose transporter 1 [Erpetoichthys calabaricus]|uniref:sodium-dependent glucose transporter 1 n=1 Tax=Erpetoichthys calabaricus TaxID=27687 RepID=UPI002233F5F8|nr:sodium-dependent glucose transporter 1 [Erpetoichthys calabaricus]
MSLAAPSATTAGGGVVKKKQVRFARTEEDDEQQDQGEEEEEEEDTLFDKWRDGRKKALQKAAKGFGDSGPSSATVIRRGGSSTASKWPTTLALCASFLGLGMSIAVLGPTFEDLAINVKKNISNISYIFVGRSMGYIGGSVVGGVLFDCVNHHLLLGFAMLITAFGLFAIPFCKKALLLTVLMSIIGITMGFLDTGGNVLTLNTWGEQAGPHMQALHFSFALGAFVSPILAKLLLGNMPAMSSTLGTNMSVEVRETPKSVTNPQLHQTVKFITVNNSKAAYLKSMWAYIVIGTFILLVSLIFFLLYSRSSPSREKTKASAEKPLVAKHHNALIGLLFLFFFWYVGAEVSYGSYIFTYTKDFAGMDESRAAGLNSLFWGTFAAARGLAIFFAACLHPGTMILLSLVGCTVSSLLLTLYCHNSVVLWIFTAIYGASMATTFPSGISWVEQYTTVTGRSAAVFVVGAALGEMVIPAVVGYLMGILQDYPLLMYTALGTSAMTAIIFPVMYKLASASGADGRKSRDGNNLREDSEDRKALLSSDSAFNGDYEEEDEAEQWNDADFEVIEMNEAGLINSLHESGPAPVTSDSPLSLDGSSAVDANVDVTEHTADTSTLSQSPGFSSSSPRKKTLSSLNREKND